LATAGESELTPSAEQHRVDAELLSSATVFCGYPRSRRQSPAGVFFSQRPDIAARSGLARCLELKGDRGDRAQPVDIFAIALAHEGRRAAKSLPRGAREGADRAMTR